MSLAHSLLPEFDQEMQTTRTMLERVPEDRYGWKPHEKSMLLGRLAAHLAELPLWSVSLLTQDELDLMPPGSEPPRPGMATSSAELLETFDGNRDTARETIAAASDATFAEEWTLKKGGRVILTLPRIAVYRNALMNHMIHHRGQLTVFLRLCDVSIPVSYGPTADEDIL